MSREHLQFADLQLAAPTGDVGVHADQGLPCHASGMARAPRELTYFVTFAVQLTKSKTWIGGSIFPSAGIPDMKT